jgi:hypothetical protein
MVNLAMKVETGRDISVVIASLLRPKLIEVLSEIRLDLPLAQIIVVAHNEPSDLENAAFSDLKIEFYRNSTNSLGRSWNLGLGKVDRKFFTFFSDDDHWIPDTLSIHRNKLENSNDDFILGSVELSKVNNRKKIKPKKLIECSFFELLKNQTLLPGTKYVSLTSFLGKQKLTGQLFDENVPFWEDILWLMKLEKLGFLFSQDRTVRSSIEINYLRGTSRESIGAYLLIAGKVNQIFRDSGTLFIRKIAVRNSIASGRSEKIKELLSELKAKEDAIPMKSWELAQLRFYVTITKVIGWVKE